MEGGKTLEHDVKLTSAEMGVLWSQYMTDTMAICVLKYFLQNVDDADTRALMEHALKLAQGHIQTVTQLFKQENFPIPVGFTDADVNLTAPRLFSDTFYLNYLDGMSKLGMVSYTAAVASSSRRDIRHFYSECLAESDALLNKCEDILIAKGLFMRPPFISTPDKVDFVKKQNFLTGFFGERRAVNAIEITNLYMNIQRSALSKALIMGFAQVAQSKQVRQHMERGKDIETKHIRIFADLLMQDDLPFPTTWDSDVTDSTVQTFSDKLMMFHVGTLTAAAIGNYGVGIGASLRRDLPLTYSRLLAEAGLYHEDGANISIHSGLLEEPPEADNRKELARQQ
jgi:hypothetical protein